MSWTLARRMRVPSMERITAPSIFDNSRRRVGAKGTSNSMPPSHSEATSSWSPRTINAPVRPRWIRSSPSRRAVPGANC